MRPTPPSRRTARSTLLVGLAVALLAGCSAASQQTGGHGSPGDDAPSRGSGSSSATPTKTPAPERSAATISVSPTSTGHSISPLTPIEVRAAGGKLRSVRVTNTLGKAVGGKTDSTGTRWKSVGRLAYTMGYHISAVAVDSKGIAARKRAVFSTVRPIRQDFQAITPLAGTTVGVGYPIVVYFKHPVTDPAEVEKRLHVTTSPRQVGAWHWFGRNTEAHWRPQVYWHANSTITVSSYLYGINLGSGVWGKSDRSVRFKVGARHVSIANSITHHMAVYNGTKMVENFPVSMGKEVAGRWTHSGVHVVNTKSLVKHMDSTTFGLALDAGGYRATVKFATRISNNGEFVHSAPWSVKQQGKSNESHGCINLNPKRAAWFYRFSRVGDVVQVVGTPVPLTPADGDIYDWTVPWAQWLD